ncbi:suppressor of lurcher protein 1-like [Bacillus rossius redtenbacheri]|uniref:suppressor of lurcher protein 1-like n=1 Tax=Bacillus rossius redtenbacheri TaxID=93214 RepID=UPI002FDCA898
MTRENVMEMLIVLLTTIMLIVIGDAVNPGCECLMFTTTYGKEYGTFSSPDYPKPYHENINCLLYSFVSSRNEIVEITFKDFDLQKTHVECARGDFLKLYLHLEHAQVNELTPWSALLCGGLADVPRLLYSSGPGLVLEFHSDPRPSNSSGFLGHFRFVDRRMFQTDGQKVPGTTCDHQFVSRNHSLTAGHFFSPRYPSSYPTNIKCAYRFRGRLKERIRVVFEEVTLQKGDASCLHQADVIKVFDGRDQLSPVIEAVCNEAAGVEVLSTGAELRVEFSAGSQWPGQGFKASYQFQPADGSTSADPDRFGNHIEGISSHQTYLGPAVSATTSNCDLVVSSDSSKNGSLSSPGFPQPYPPSSYCQYDFQGRGKERVQVVFSHFNLYASSEKNPLCDSIDSLVAFVHISGRKEKIDAFCGTALPKPIMSNGPRLMLEFRGIYSSPYSTGFKATYSFTENFGIRAGRQLSDYPCAFEFDSNVTRNGSFHSPNHPGYYPRDTECHFFFHGGASEKVRLRFGYFDVEGVAPCEASTASDYVEFSNFMARDRKYPRQCGQQPAFDVESDRKFFRVTFRSNDRLDGTGFRASYQFLDKAGPLQGGPAHKSRAPRRPGFVGAPAAALIISVISMNICC